MSKEVCPWVWACHGRRVKPSVHHRPQFPMSARERLYEIRKRHRKTEIWSESWRLDFKANDFCQFCLGLEDGECIADDCFGCPYARERNAYRCRIEAEARFHRPTRRERLFERRKCIRRKANAFRRAARRANRNRQWKLRDRCLLRYQMTRLLMSPFPR